MKPDEFKSLVETLSKVIDARAKTTETIVKAEIKASEERITEQMRADILAARAEAKADHLHLAGKVDRIAKSHDRRLEALEEKTGSPDLRNTNHCLHNLPLARHHQLCKAYILGYRICAFCFLCYTDYENIRQTQQIIVTKADH